jgi:hypothetical protein
VPEPQPVKRPKHDNPVRVSVLARRIAPARCIALPARTRVTYRGDALARVVGAEELYADGSHAPLLAPGQSAPEYPPPPPRGEPRATAP